MEGSVFRELERSFQTGGAEAAFACLVQKFLEEKSYAQLFQARLLKKRFELGLSLVPSSTFENLPSGSRQAYEAAFIEAAREAGDLFLAEGDIPKAWPYFRAIGDSASIKAAIDRVEQHENLPAIIDIAFQEQVHPRKGFELILRHYGLCRAISSVFQYPDPETRKDCIALLIRNLHSELIENLKRALARAEGKAPESSDISRLIADRSWLFADNTYYIDTSHVVSVVQYSLELSDRETLELALQLAEYGTCLGPMFQRCGNPPFERFEDYAVYLRGLLGKEPDTAVAHFRRKLAELDPMETGTAPAQVLVGLLGRLERYSEAIAISLEHLKNTDANQLACPSALQLCYMAGDFQQLRNISAEQGDLISFTAALVHAK
jgi:hypothetical protein